MDRIVLDASALLAFLKDERGSEKMTREVFANSTISTVNLAEVHTKLVSEGFRPEDAWQEASGYVDNIQPFTADQAKLAGDLTSKTSRYGLSLGDRACLALAITLDAPVYTTDKAWKDVKVGCRIHLIR